MKMSLYASPTRRLEVAAARRALVDPKSRQVNAALTLTPDSPWKAISARRVRNKKWTPRGASKVRGEELRPAAAKAAGRRSSVNDFAVQGQVETVALHLFGNAQADRDVDDLQDDEGNDRVVDDDRGHPLELVDELPDVALQQAGVAAELVDRKHARQQRADDAADRMHAEAIKRIVVAEGVLEGGRAKVAADPASDANHQRADRADEARSRGDGDEAGDCARADADDRRLAAMRPFDEHPGQRRDRGGDLRDGHRHAGLQARGHRRAGVEAEPADP